MDKEKFHLLIRNYTVLEKSEVDELSQLQREFPYCQVIHNMLTRSASDLELTDKDKYLHRSAIYTTDRSVLKAIMISEKSQRKEVNEYKTEIVVIQPQAVIPIKELISTNTGEALYNEVIHDLDELSKSKSRFEEIVNHLEGEIAKPLSVPLDSPIINEDIVEEIKVSKKKIRADDPKQKEQKDIIDQFIKTQPSISPAKSVHSKTEDLSDKYDIYGENIVSETLVEILLKQGKKEKAIEMLKKLIWKFPQKKAYFAAQIEELKK